MNHRFAFILTFAMAGFLPACGNSDDATSTTGTTMTDAQFSAKVAVDMQTTMQGSLQDLVTSAQALQAAAPSTAWDNTDPAWATMKAAWIKARHDYEHVEGATAPIYPDIDISIDGRVEDFGPSLAGTLVTDATTGAPACTDMFGTSCMSGLHAAERVLWAAQVTAGGDVTQETPASVAVYEASLGYVVPQAFPGTDAEALEFKNVLLAKIVADAQTLLSGWTSQNIIVAEAFQGLVGLMNESHEKVSKAGLHEEESRYSQRTMDDLRANLEGTMTIYTLFEPWLASKAGGSEIGAKIQAGFTTLSNVYAESQFASVAFPTPPSDWSDVDPSAVDLATPFGTLYGAVNTAIDPTTDGSIVFEMNAAATLLSLPQFQG
jgi:iron uptake system component EfeO